MATDVTAQHFTIIAKDLVIAALQAGKVPISGASAQAQGENLAAFYNAILNGISERSK